MPTLTYREAARRVDRSTRAIRRWKLHGMPMGWDTRNGQKVRVVDETVLLAYWRQTLRNWPIHQQRLRTLQAREETAHAQPEPIREPT